MHCILALFREVEIRPRQRRSRIIWLVSSIETQLLLDTWMRRSYDDV
jgi:hypothetical protein